MKSKEDMAREWVENTKTEIVSKSNDEMLIFFQNFMNLPLAQQTIKKCLELGYINGYDTSKALHKDKIKKIRAEVNKHSSTYSSCEARIIARDLLQLLDSMEKE